MEFYNMTWYKMPIKHQKKLLCAIHYIQNGAVLTMGPLGELDFEMTSRVTTILFNSAWFLF